MLLETFLRDVYEYKQVNKVLAFDSLEEKIKIISENISNEEISDKISDKLQKITVYMQGNSGIVTQAEVAEMFKISDRQARNYLSLLINDGRIIALGANKNRTYTLMSK